MNNYELTVVLSGETGTAKVKSFTTKLEKDITSLRGKVKEKKEWGKIDLSFPIKKQKSGVFLHFILEIDPKGTKALNDRFKLDSDIIRYLLIRAGE